jgi:hypothetical protein
MEQNKNDITMRIATPTVLLSVRISVRVCIIADAVTLHASPEPWRGVAQLTRACSRHASLRVASVRIYVWIYMYGPRDRIVLPVKYFQSSLWSMVKIIRLNLVKFDSFVDVLLTVQYRSVYKLSVNRPTKRGKEKSPSNRHCLCQK